MENTFLHNIFDISAKYEFEKCVARYQGNFKVAIEVALLYEHRWKIELFFKWIKQHLKIKTFWGETKNAVKTQIWIAVCTYLMVAIARKELKLERNLYEILQIISVSIFEKTQLNQLRNASPS